MILHQNIQSKYVFKKISVIFKFWFEKKNSLRATLKQRERKNKRLIAKEILEYIENIQL